MFSREGAKGAKKTPNFFATSLVAGAAGDLFAVEVFEQWNCILARDAREVFKGRNVDQTIGLMLGGVSVQLGF